MSHRKGEKKRLWSQDDMELALQDVRSKELNPTEASKKYKIPRKTITDRLEKKVKDDWKGGGSGTILSKEHEEALCSYIEYMAFRAFPLTVSQIMTYAWCIDRKEGRSKFGENGPCYTWWLGFKSRHPDCVKLRKPDSLNRGHALFSTVDNLRNYFQILNTILTEGNFSNRPQDVFNCDETIVDLNKSSQKVVVPRRFRTSHSQQVASSEHVTIHCCISAAGHAIPPFVIYKAAFPGGNYTSGGPDGALYGKQQTGFMDSELFVKWFTKLFIPHARPTPERSVLLLVDGHSSHCSPEVIKAARDNNVIRLALAPHTTHLCQPLDVAVYKSIKVQLSKLVKLGQALRGDLWVTKSNIARMLKQPFEASMTMSNIKAGFRKCGIHPFNPNAIDKTQLCRNKLIPNENVGLSIPPETQEETIVDSGNRSDDVPANDQLNDSVSGIIILNENDEIIPVLHSSPPPVSTGTINPPEDLMLGAALPYNLSDQVLDFNLDISYPLPNLRLNLSETPSLFSAVNSEAQIIPTLHSPIRIKISTKNSIVPPSDGSIVLIETHKDVGTQVTSEKDAPIMRNTVASNPLVTTGLITLDLAEIFYPPDEAIPVGRKRPLRTKSKARVMTSQEVFDDLVNQQVDINARTARREERLVQRGRNQQRRGRGAGRGRMRVQPQQENDTEREPVQHTAEEMELPQEEVQVQTRTRNDHQNSIRGTRQSKRRNVSQPHLKSEEDNNCFLCTVDFNDESRANKSKWVGCETEDCPHWVCPRCLVPDFDYSNNYYCDDCELLNN